MCLQKSVNRECVSGPFPIRNITKITYKHMYSNRRFFRIVSSCSIRSYAKDSSKKLLETIAKMPKVNSPRIAEAQRQRQTIAKKSEKYGSSTVYLQVLGSGARGAPNTLYLFTDQKRYLFNCGEGTQRLAHEHKVKLSRLEHIFITSKTWKCIGGLPGLSLTLQDVGVPNITLHGPSGLDELYNATKRFVIMKDMQVTMADCSVSADYEDNVMTVKYVFLGPLDEILTNERPQAKKPKLVDSIDKQYEEFSHDDTDYYQPNKNTKTNTTNPREMKKVIDVPKNKSEKVLKDLVTHNSKSTVSYICTLKKRLGTLDLAKCVEKGVKPGPLLGRLKSGHDVVLPSGELVRSRDVKTPDDPGPVFIVLEVPKITYLKESEFAGHFDDGSNSSEKVPALVVHYTPPEVMAEPRYQAFMFRFGPNTSHLVLNSSNSCMGSEAVHRTQHKLHLLDPDIFPLLRDASVPAIWNTHEISSSNDALKAKGLEELKNKIALAQFQNIVNMESASRGAARASPDELRGRLLHGRTLAMYHLRPKKEYDRSAEPKLHVQDYIQESMDIDGFVPSLEKFRQMVDELKQDQIGPTNEYPRVVFLGTGSCIPSKTRNTSAIVLHIDEERSMLLDCGEGTFGQLVRFYGPRRVDAFLRTLRAVYVSHLHADHHIGLIGVIQARSEAFKDHDNGTPVEPLYLLAPGQIVTWLSMYDQQFQKLRNEFTLLPNQNLLTNAAMREPLSPAILASIGVQDIQTCFVSHCPNAFGVSVVVNEDNKITYSGDTIPCENLVELGQNSKLLIHEATMEDELEIEARVKMHSTTSQAIEIGERMNAQYTVLTHFSQRYARLPRLNQTILNDNRKVGIAFDNMQLTMTDLDLIPHMYAPLQLMFAEHCVEMELKAQQRALKKSFPNPPKMPTAAEEAPKERRSYGISTTGGKMSSPKSTYKETNSSRLRQESIGIKIGKSRSHSTSLSKMSDTRTDNSLASEAQTRRNGHAVNELRRDLSRNTFDSDVSGAFEVRGSDESDVLSRSGPFSVSSAKSYNTQSSRVIPKALCRKDTLPLVPLESDTEVKVKNRRSNVSFTIIPSATDETRFPLDALNDSRTSISTVLNDLEMDVESHEVISRSTSKYCANRDRSLSPRPIAEAGRFHAPTKMATERGLRYPNRFNASADTSRTSTLSPKQHQTYKKITATKNNLDKVSNKSRQSVRSNESTAVKIDAVQRTSSESLSLKTKTSALYKTKNCNLTSTVVMQTIHDPSSSNKMKTVNRDDSDASKERTRAVPGRLNNPYNRTKAFKPQLEDIASSFLLLKGSEQTDSNEDIRNEAYTSNKSSLDVTTLREREAKRRVELERIKEKYRSREFFVESKYEKIEGLNWISWK